MENVLITDEDKFPTWEVTFKFKADVVYYQDEIQYKYVIISSDTGEIIHWENIPHNRVISLRSLVEKQGTNEILIDDNEFGRFGLHNFKNFTRICATGDVARARELISLGVDVNLHDTSKTGASPLYRACSNNQEDIVRLLLDHVNIDPNGGDYKFFGRYSNECAHETPLYAAIANQNVQIVELLLAHPRFNINLGKTYKPSETPMSLAYKVGNNTIVEMLQNKGGNAMTGSGMLNTSGLDVSLDGGDDLFSMNDKFR